MSQNGQSEKREAMVWKNIEESEGEQPEYFQVPVAVPCCGCSQSPGSCLTACFYTSLWLPLLCFYLARLRRHTRSAPGSTYAPPDPAPVYPHIHSDWHCVDSYNLPSPSRRVFVSV